MPRKQNLLFLLWKHILPIPAILFLSPQHHLSLSPIWTILINRICCLTTFRFPPQIWPPDCCTFILHRTFFSTLEYPQNKFKHSNYCSNSFIHSCLQGGLWKQIGKSKYNVIRFLLRKCYQSFWEEHQILSWWVSEKFPLWKKKNTYSYFFPSL